MEPIDFSPVKAQTINEFFGTLQEAFNGTWIQHLKASDRDVHVILNEFYDELPDLVDKIIEDYMGVFGKIESYTNIIEYGENPIQYLKKLLSMCDNSVDLLQGRSELNSDLDAIKSLIDSTIYKLEQLTDLKESKHLSDFLTKRIFD